MMGDGVLVGDLSRPFEDGLSARMLLSSIRRHLTMVLAFTVSLCIAGALIGLGLPAWFQAQGIVVIHSRPHRMADLQELPDPAPDLNVIQSEVDILKSRSVIEPVVRSLRLWEAPEFQKTEYPKGWNWPTVRMRVGELWDSIRDLVKGPETSSGEVKGPETSSDEQAPTTTEPADANVSGAPNVANNTKPPTQAEIDDAVEAYAGYLLVETDGRSMTIRVSYRAWTPERAAAIVNAQIDSYQNIEVKTKVTAAERANSALNSQVAELRRQLQTAEAAVTNYRETHHLTGAAKDSAGVSQQLVALNNQLITARADLAESEARAARIGAGGDSVPEVVNSGTISALRSQEAQLVAREADLAKYHGDEYPDLRRARASLQNLRDQISREIGRNRNAALQIVERSRTRERTLQQSITELTKQVNSGDAGLQQLQGNADSIRSLLVNFEKRRGETAASPAFITPNSTIASRANASATSTSPKAPALAVGGGFVGLTLGSLLALFRELRDKGFRTSTQVQQHIGSLTVSATPRALGRRRKSPADIILHDTGSAFAEALRVTWANLQLAAAGPRSAALGGRRQGTALGVTSATSGEGKSTHALALARTAALAGEAVVLVDADQRRSGVSRLLDQDFCFTMRDFLQDRCRANDVIAIEERSGMHFVPSVPAHVTWTSQDLQRFFKLIDYLKDRFAVVIIDLPPLLGIAETIRLAMAADNIALVVRWGRTERQFVQYALDALGSASLSPTAVILNDIDLKAQRRRGYRDHTEIYTDKRLYQAAAYRWPAPGPTLPIAAADADEYSAVGVSAVGASEPQPVDTHRERSHPAGSDIERLYNRYQGS
jgi:uncharacterized protein involved in exopolysaccharide biosynthesis/Mrp family chromosome partitioning ATPase